MEDGPTCLVRYALASSPWARVRRATHLTTWLPPRGRRVPRVAPRPRHSDGARPLDGRVHTARSTRACTAYRDSKRARLEQLPTPPVRATNQELEMRQADTRPRAVHGAEGWSYGNQTRTRCSGIPAGDVGAMARLLECDLGGSAGRARARFTLTVRLFLLGFYEFISCCILLKNLPIFLIVFPGLLSVKRAVVHNERETPSRKFFVPQN